MGNQWTQHFMNGNIYLLTRYQIRSVLTLLYFLQPDEENAEYIKRVIGLPGDKVEYKEDQLYINGKKYDEPYLDSEKEALKNGYLTTDAEGDPNFTMATFQTLTALSLSLKENFLF